jgi:type IV secretory pathway VirB10-like protein
LTTNVEIAKNDPTKVTVVSSTVDSVLSTPSTTSVTSMTSVNSVIAPPPPPAGSPTANATAAAAAPPPPPPPAKQEERAQDQKKTDSEVAKVEKKSGDNKADAKKEIAAKAVEIAKNASKAATLEAQTAHQGLLVGLIGYVPGFSGYQQATIPDTMSAAVAKAYHKPTVDNRNVQRRLSGANEARWQEMVDSQYK